MNSMQLLTKQKKALGLIALMAISNLAFALEFIIKDQEGAPVTNAFVALIDGEQAEPLAEKAVMDQIDVRFSPNVLAINLGQRVIFPNSDNIRHHVYSFSKPKQFEIQLYQGVPESPIEFDQPGVVVLGCNIHDSMQGYIVVSPWANYLVTDESGVATFEGSAEQVAIWHPDMEDISEPILVSLSSETELTITLKPKQPTRSFNRFRTRYDD